MAKWKLEVKEQISLLKGRDCVDSLSAAHTKRVWRIECAWRTGQIFTVYFCAGAVHWECARRVEPSSSNKSTFGDFSNYIHKFSLQSRIGRWENKFQFARAGTVCYHCARRIQRRRGALGESLHCIFVWARHTGSARGALSPPAQNSSTFSDLSNSNNLPTPSKCVNACSMIFGIFYGGLEVEKTSV